MLLDELGADSHHLRHCKFIWLSFDDDVQFDAEYGRIRHGVGWYSEERWKLYKV